MDLNFLPDTSCYELTLRLANNSTNANAYFWDFGQGDTSNLTEPIVTFPNLGTYNVMLVAIEGAANTGLAAAALALLKYGAQLVLPLP